MNTFTLKVIAIRKETADTITLCFKQPGLRKIKYQAGQYLTLIFRINGRRYIRPYSFSSAPATDSLLEITIKRVANGIVSNHIHDVIKIDDSIEVMQPMGDFVCETPSTQIFLWGVGSGITPLISLAKQIIATNPTCKVNLIYGNRNHMETIFFDQIQELQLKYKNQFVVKHFHTRMQINHDIPDLIEGRIDQEKAAQILAQLNCENESKHFICGPAGLKESVKAALALNQVPAFNIYAEDFELMKDPKDFESIHTQTIKIKFEQREYDLEVTKGKSILESALDAGIELPYSCQTGSCSTCKGKLIQGKAQMIGLINDRDDLLTDEYLVCCTHPLSEDVYIEID
ncbi:ferredoxin--NADP reductase [Pedobacter cryotolerans]|uniref:Ferredoxin--NADP reductase n=1 Tax=Pedobacter cryotolerans TaxID=2571270 RepID=A0A4U1CDV0_9SPHI|nr:ferredoxin--NADP reductase [Pedobacter cryotolerans]TKC03487.1 ferredoxin--NADP reductase [Pedobacter cryotolerans]